MIYISTSCLKRNTIGRILKEYGENGIKNIELSGGTEYYEDIEADLRKYKKEYELNYACHAYFPPPKEDFVVNLASCNDKIYKQSVEHYERCIEMLDRNNIRVLSIHAGFLVEITTQTIGRKIVKPIVYEEKEAYSRFCEAYRHIATLCRQNQIDFYLENNVLSGENYKEFHNHNYFMMTDYDSIQKMSEQLEFKLLLDLGHLYVSSHTLELSYDEQCEKLKPYIKWLHVSENNGIIDMHQPLTEQSDITRQARSMGSTHGNITLETNGSIMDIKRSMDILKTNGK